jgi:hypothetical protein
VPDGGVIERKGNQMKTTIMAMFSVLLGIVSANVAQSAVRSVVLVHGSFADGSGWKPVADILEHGETAGALQAKTPPASNNVVSVGGGFVQEKPEAFPADFAADVPKPLASFMAISRHLSPPTAFRRRRLSQRGPRNPATRWSPGGIG